MGKKIHAAPLHKCDILRHQPELSEQTACLQQMEKAMSFLASLHDQRIASTKKWSLSPLNQQNQHAPTSHI